ncbi:hypothetical protein BDL97_17G078200 [Sphagnum fallax]|nr:hypothetical protein BDL97_17G078200 [Sphagnum fallax]
MAQAFAEDEAMMKAEFEEWGTKTTIGVLAGMLYGGLREALGSVEKEKVLLHSAHDTKQDFRHRHNSMRQMAEHRVLRIARGTVLGGAKLGAFTAVFCGVQHGLAVKRGCHDTYNVVVAGGVTGAAFGLTVPGSLRSRLRFGAIGSILGTAVCFPLGLAYTTLQSQLQQQQQQQQQQEESQQVSLETNEGDKGGIGAVIKRLENSASVR